MAFYTNIKDYISLTHLKKIFRIVQLQHRQWNKSLGLQNNENQHQGPRSGPPNTDVLFSPPPTIFLIQTELNNLHYIFDTIVLYV